MPEPPSTNGWKSRSIRSFLGGLPLFKALYAVCLFSDFLSPKMKKIIFSAEQ